jgi:hypothetical protein
MALLIDLPRPRVRGDAAFQRERERLHALLRNGDGDGGAALQ